MSVGMGSIRVRMSFKIQKLWGVEVGLPSEFCTHPLLSNIFLTLLSFGTWGQQLLSGGK